MTFEELDSYEELVSNGLIKAEFLPLPEVSRCFVSRNDEGKITGYIFIQTMVTIEPIWVDEKSRGTNLALKLFGHAACALAESGTARYFVTHADRPEIADYLRRMGLEELNWKTFKMDLTKQEG